MPAIRGVAPEFCGLTVNVAAKRAGICTCARENGFPEPADPAPPVADGRMTTPTAVRPADTAPEELDELLVECPADVNGEDSVREVVPTGGQALIERARLAGAAHCFSFTPLSRLAVTPVNGRFRASRPS